jgi:flagellar basal body-associated protein FliL
MPDVPVISTPKIAPKKSKSRLTVVLTLLLAVSGVSVWLFSERSTSAAGGAATESTLALEMFVVNLNTTGQRAYLRVGITLGSAQSFQHNKPDAIPTALVRDTILSVLASAKPEELLKAEGKRQLKDELLKALQERVPRLAIDNVYFTEFLVQM